MSDSARSIWSKRKLLRGRFATCSIALHVHEHTCTGLVRGAVKQASTVSSGGCRSRETLRGFQRAHHRHCKIEARKTCARWSRDSFAACTGRHALTHGLRPWAQRLASMGSGDCAGRVPVQRSAKFRSAPAQGDCCTRGWVGQLSRRSSLRKSNLLHEAGNSTRCDTFFSVGVGVGV